MGSYQRSFIVDGVEYELFAQVEGDETVFQLVDPSGREIGEPLTNVPTHAEAAALVRTALGEPF